jgi:CPA1 family monovalent cation:H+ antiporter
MHLEVILSLFTLMLISIGVFFLSQRMKIPYTVLLVVVGSLLVPLSHIEIFSFIDSFQLTPELLFFVFLPILIFESAYNMNIRKMAESAWSISLLAVVSLILSAFFVALGMFYGLKLIGFDIPFVVALLFGALISATDPVAVLALFKEYGAPRRLALIFEGESLFNDGTSLALFLIILEVLVHGFGGAISVMEGVFMFTTMIVGGIGLGLVMGAIFAKLIERVKDNENIEITLTMLVAHFTFILAEILSEHLVIFGYEIKFSSIIATVVASMLIGNYGRYKISSRVEEYMEKFWGYFAFIANSLVFILMGLLFANLNIDF